MIITKGKYFYFKCFRDFLVESDVAGWIIHHILGQFEYNLQDMCINDLCVHISYLDERH